MEDQLEVGSVKYSGKAVARGVLDAGKAGKALTGLDDLLRYFNAKQSSDLAKAEYDVPVSVREGSWEAVVLGAVGLVAGKFVLTYATHAAEQMAKRDFDGVGFKDIFAKSLAAIVHLVRLAKHTKRVKGWPLENLRWNSDSTEVGIPNDAGEYQYFSPEFIKWYAGMQPGMLAKLAEVVEEERVLTISVRDQRDGAISETVTIREKRIFTGSIDELEEEDFLFPELEHGAEARLEGVLIRGNAESNSIGLHYRGHSLNCVPEEGSIVQYKPALFLKCVVEGRITRLSKSHTVAERRPTIIVRRVTPLERDGQRVLL